MFIDDAKTINRLVKLVKETFSLWDESWVDFSWKHYYYEHTQRVRALALKIGRNEGADLRKLEYAALLHDITKRYDGRILRDAQGKRVLDEYGFWRNELLMPKRQNLVTRLYDELNQFNKLHNISGALIAKKIIESQGLSEDFSNSVATIIEGHLKLNNGIDTSLPNALERNILYEADTLDANLGLIAFYRNIQINTHNAIDTKGGIDLRQYVVSIEPWIQTKVPFIDRMATKTSIQIAKERHERMKMTYAQIVAESKNMFDQSLKYGILGCLKFFMDHNQEPNLQEEIDYLLNNWIPNHEQILRTEANPEVLAVFKRAVSFCHDLVQEIQGKA